MRQSFAADALDPVGLYFGTTGGEIQIICTLTGGAPNP